MQTIATQLRGVCEGLGVPLTSAGGGAAGGDAVRRCLTASAFLNVAKRLPAVPGTRGRASYVTAVGNQTVYIHPASVLFNRNPAPECVV